MKRDQSPVQPDSAYSSGSSQSPPSAHPPSQAKLEKFNEKHLDIGERPSTSRSMNPPSRKLNLFPTTAASLSSTRGQSQISVLLKDQTYADPYGPPRLYPKPKEKKPSNKGMFGKLFGKWNNKTPEINVS
jgi:hypothetical protein